MSWPSRLRSVTYLLTSTPRPQLSMYGTSSRLSSTFMQSELHEPVDGVAKHIVSVALNQPALQVEDRQVADRPFGDLHQSRYFMKMTSFCFSL